MIVWSLPSLKNPQMSLWVYLRRYVIAEVGYYTLVSVKNNTRESRTFFSPVSSCFGITDQCCFLKCLYVSSLDVLFAQGRPVDLCPQMTQLPLNSLLIFTQVHCSSVVSGRPIDLAMNNRIILIGWGWTEKVRTDIRFPDLACFEFQCLPRSAHCFVFCFCFSLLIFVILMTSF